ncbi:hypothetical protein EG68_02751 [Paragonimus skrjabini miyazakii]|uniref:Virilizer N-terminal domain-containing protein n=1 Tax=Paragonimus skrjabini miyazakii TaxID=59628 RepID=A0A8S9Z4E4_9TREM|nr:hypothetical protein EG68_02751 [Paragonimus skrjabini miyazakii]
MTDPFIVFFDTFMHNEHTQESVDCIRFKSGVQLLEIRILPFGSVVESDLSDEAVIGHHFDEKNGINCIVFKEPVSSNFLLFRGRYSTLTIAIFGIPTISLSQTIQGGTNLSIPPPQIGLVTSVSVGDISTAPVVYEETGSTSFAPSLLRSSPEIQPSWTQVETTTANQRESLEPNTKPVGGLQSEFASEDRVEDVYESAVDTGGLYEDGEIQDIDYEEISSNEELFSDTDDIDAIEDGRQPTDQFTEDDPRLARCYWRFNPWSMAAKCATGSLAERVRIPDPTMTLFQLHCWLLEREERIVTTEPDVKVATSDTDHTIDDGNVDDTATDESTRLPPPPDDWTTAAASAQYLLTITLKFTTDPNKLLTEEWVDAIEGLESHLAPGLAYLYHTDRQSMQSVTEALVVWVYTGLDLSAALRQSNSAYIVRHLLAGVRLTGLVTGTLFPRIAWSLLYPGAQSLAADGAQFEVFQVQHLLLNLLESPLVTTPLRLAICRALDRTTRLVVGLDAFLGRAHFLSLHEPADHQLDVASPSPLEIKDVPLVNKLCDSDDEMQEDKPMIDVSTKTVQASAENNQMHEEASFIDNTVVKEELTERISHLSENDEPSDQSTRRTPYQRLMFLFVASKHSRITSAYQRLLNKLHVYEMLLEFRDLMSQLRFETQSGPRISMSLSIEQKLVYYLRQISNLLQHADEVIANPLPTTLPCPMLLGEDKKSAHDPYPDLCTMLDHTGFLDDFAWLFDQFHSSDQLPSLQAKPDENLSPLTSSRETQSPPDAVSVRNSEPIWSSIVGLMSSFLSEVSTLTLLASRPGPTSKMLVSLLKSASRITSMKPHRIVAEWQVDTTEMMLVLGLELAYKLETLRYLDVLINWTRKQEDDPMQSEPLLRDALFGIARLCVSSVGSIQFGDLNSTVLDTVKTILNTSAPIWVAEVISMDDHFAPFLMLLEAFGTQESQGSLPHSKSSDKLKDLDSVKKVTNTSDSSTLATTTDATPSSGLRATLRQILMNPIDPSTLVNFLVLTVLRHSENVAYLNRYGPRLAQLVTNYTWEDNLSDSAAFNTLTHAQSFSRSGSPFLYWLRDCPSRLSSMNLLTLCKTNSLSSEIFIWLVNQLKPLVTELEEALDGLLSVETVDDLLGLSGPVVSNQVGRKQSVNVNIIAGRSIPPAILTLLRLIRSHVCNQSGKVIGLIPRPEQQVVLRRSLSLIELYSANGLCELTSLIQKLSDYFVLQCQTTVSQTTCVLDLIGITTANSNTSLVVSMLEASVHIVAQLLTTILHVQGDEFRDLTPVRPLCLAYTCGVYAVSPLGPKRKQLERLRSAVVTALLAYLNADIGTALSIKEIAKSLWVSVCREVITFTISAPAYYLPGLKLLLDLLPLPLPIFNANSLTEASQQRIRSARDRWAIHVLALAPEFTGLVELLGGTNPDPNNPLYSNLLQLLRRLADLGLSCATFLATACLDSLFIVWDELFEELRKKPITTDRGSDDGGDVTEKPLPPNRSDSAKSLTDDASNISVPLRTPSARLLLHSASGADSAIDVTVSNCCGDAVERSVQDAAGSDSSNAKVLVDCFSDLNDSSELTSALALLHANLQVPACRLVILHLLRQNSAPSGASCRNSKSADGSSTKGDQSNTSTRKRRFLFIAENILSACSDKLCHLRSQLVLLKCLGLLFDIESASACFESEFTFGPTNDTANVEAHKLHLANNLPDASCSEELAHILITHLSHPDRDMTTLPSALRPLLLLTQHDHGFLLVKNVLDNCAAQTNGQHFFANMVQRVNDCFSIENPDCQDTLASCLRLLQSLVVGRSTLPLTFNNDSADCADESQVDTAQRSLHISGARVRDLLGWSKDGDEGKPVRDLHALLEMLTDDEPSLEYLRSGMKNLLSLLSEEFDVPECQSDATEYSSLPQPSSLEVLFSSRPYFVSLVDLAEDPEKAYEQLLKARRCLRSNFSTATSEVSEVISKSSTASSLVTCNLAELASSCCNGLRIREELAKFGRQRDSAEAAIRHQKRRRGQSSIIETGRSSKKFVAPMRGRGFILRGVPTQSGGQSLNSAGSGLGGLGSGTSLIGGTGNRVDPFRSRPLNTSRPPSLHVDDFTKLVKDDTVVEDPPRSRPYRDSRGLRGRGLRVPSTRGGSTTLGPVGSLHSNLMFGLNVPSLNPLNAAVPLLPTWPTSTRSIPLLSFNLDPRNTQGRRDRPLR